MSLDNWTAAQGEEAKAECRLSEREKEEFKNLSGKKDLSEDETRKLMVFQGRLSKLETLRLWFPDK